jgi:hypothetical protein
MRICLVLTVVLALGSGASAAKCEHILDRATESSKAPARYKPHRWGRATPCDNSYGITQFGLALAKLSVRLS